LNPVHVVDKQVLNSLGTEYNLSPLLLIPALIILAAPFIRMNIKAAMGISILFASVLAVSLQGMGIVELIRTLLLGYDAKGELSALLSGGGVKSMAHGCAMIVVSATYSGIFNGTNMLSSVEKFLEKISERFTLLQITALTSFPMIMFSCNQTLALMLQVPLLRPLYQKKGISNEKMMLDTANTTVLFSALVPWCLACSMPLEMLGVSAGCIPLAFFLYLPAVVSLLRETVYRHFIQ